MEKSKLIEKRNRLVMRKQKCEEALKKINLDLRQIESELELQNAKEIKKMMSEMSMSFEDLADLMKNSQNSFSGNTGRRADGEL